MGDPKAPVEVSPDAAAALAPVLPPSEEPQATTHGHQTARRAIRVLLEKAIGFHEPTRRERDALLVGFAMHRRVLYGAAFDVIRLSRPVDLTDPAAIASEIDAITVYEIKSTNRPGLKADLKGYFFNVTAAELLVAQSLGIQFRFAFVNTLSGDYQEMSLNEIFARSRAMYPAWHIRF
jgi:hypothetical protein